MYLPVLKLGKGKEKNKDGDEPMPPSTAENLQAKDPDGKAREMLVKHPYVSAPTYYNMLKAEGLKISESYRKIKRAKQTAAKGVDPEKFDRCVQKVKKKGSAVNAYAVCNASLQCEKCERGVAGPVTVEPSGSQMEKGIGGHVAHLARMGNTGAGVTSITSFQKGMRKLISTFYKNNPDHKNIDTPQTISHKRPVKHEADAASTNVAVLRKGAKKESMRFIGAIKHRMRESAKDDGIGPTRFKAILIQEGLGNLRDTYYYSRNALESAISVFEGAKCYANHPSATEEQDRPERDIKDIVGHFENVHIENGEDDRAQLVADLVLLADKPYEWVRGQVKHAVEHGKKFPDKTFIGLSINANGDSDEISTDDLLKRGVPDSAQPKLRHAIAEGINEVKLVNKITDAVSCDLVTEPGAGGKVIDIVE